MPALRALHPRRRRRGTASKRRKRRNLVKFIPEGDSDFAFTAERFLWSVRSDPPAFGIDERGVAEISEAVEGFRSALARALYKQGRTQQTIGLKDSARRKCEQVIRRWANIIRANPDVDGVKKTLLRLKPRPTRLKDRKCPQNPPTLEYLGSGDGVAQDVGIGNGSGVHVLKFSGNNARNIFDPEIRQNRRAKPDGAARLELFVDLVPVGHPIPRHPAELTGRPWYLGSFTTSRMEVKYPIPSEPMLVVYWGRWADAKGRVGRFSKTCTARVEGWSQSRPALPAADESRRIETKIVYVQVSRSEPAALADHSGMQHEIIEPARRRLEATEVRQLPEVA